MNIRIFLFALLFLAGCQKPPNRTDYNAQGPLYAIPAEMKEWTMFKPGSYWIYKNETTNESDSSTYKYGPYFEQIPCGNCPVEQNMWFFANAPFYVKFELRGGADSNAALWITTRDMRTATLLTYLTLIHPDACNLSGYGYTYKCLGAFNNFVLNGNTFMHVIGTRWAATEYYYEPDFFIESYFSPNIGLIKFREHSSKGDTTWSLVKWHTVQ